MYCTIRYAAAFFFLNNFTLNIDTRLNGTLWKKGLFLLL